MAYIRLNKIGCFGHHGVTAEEKEKGGMYEIDCELEIDTTAAAKSDNINDALDYEIVYNIIKDHLENRRYNLMETLAEKLLKEIKMIPGVSGVKLRARKLSPPVSGAMDSFEVELSG